MPTERSVWAVAGLTRRQLARGSYGWATVAFLAAYGTAKGYTSAYPSAASRQRLSTLLLRNPALQAINGVARQVDTAGGFVAWRIGGVLMIIVAAWGLVAATRLLRGEEDAGRADMVRAGAVTGTQATVAALAVLAADLALVGVSVFAALVSARLPMTGSVVLAAGVVITGLTFAALGALTSQLVLQRSRATELAAAGLGVSYAVRVIADGTRGLGWLRWWTPLGWAEETRPYAGNVAWPLALLLILAALITAGAVGVQRRRDLGAGALFADRAARSRLGLLGSPVAFALRCELTAIAVWTASVGAYAVLVGVLAKDITAFLATSQSVQDIATRLAVGTLARPAGFLAFMFTFFAPPIALMGVFQLGAARTEETAGRLEVVLASAVTRWRWLAGRVVVGAVAVAVAALMAGLLAWAGAAEKGADVSLVDMEKAGLNVLPVALLFLALAVATFGLQPRLTVAIGAGGVAVSYLVQLIGALLKAPVWVLDLSPFHHLAAVPVAPANAPAAAVMLTMAAALVALGLIAFNRRDVAGL